MEPVVFTEESSERKVAIVGSELVENYTVYIISVSDSLHQWTVKHRYSAFHELHEKLTAENKVDRRLLPPKKILGKNSKTLVERRQKELEQYLQTLLVQFPQATPPALSCFLHLQLYEVNGVTAALAEELFHKGEQLLVDGQVFTLHPLQLYSVTQQLRLAKPTCFTGDAKTDLGHILDFTCRLKYLKISGAQGPVGSSNIQEKTLPFDLSIFKSLLQIEITECSSQQISGLSSLRQSLATMSVHHSTESMTAVLVPEASEFPQWEPEGAPSVCPVTAVVPVWKSLTTLDLSHNDISAVDSSVKLIPKVEFLDLSYNQLSSVENLQHLYSLVHVDLSYNRLCSLDAAHTRLGNIKTLGLSGNQLCSLQGLSKLYSLVNLDLSHNQLSQLEEIKSIGSLPCLEKLSLSDNPMCIIPDYRTKALAQFGDRAAEVCLDGKATTEKELDTVEVLKAIQKAKDVKDRKSNNSSSERKPALPSQAVTSSREETAVAPCVVPRADKAPPPENISHPHTTTPTASTEAQVQTQGEHCEAAAPALCCVCSPPAPQTDTPCFCCSAPSCPLLPPELLPLLAHTDFISQMSLRLESALNEDWTDKEEEPQKEKEECDDPPEINKLNSTSPGSRDGYFEMGLDDSGEESSSTLLPVEAEEEEERKVQAVAQSDPVQVSKVMWCCCLLMKSDEVQMNVGCLVLTDRLLGLLPLSHDFSSSSHGLEPTVLLPRLVSSLQKTIIIPLSDLKLCCDWDLPAFCYLCLRSKSSQTQLVLFSDPKELQQTKAELGRLLEMDPVPPCDPAPGLPPSLLNSWEQEESRSADGGFPALLCLCPPSSEQLPPPLQDALGPAPHLPRLLFLSHRQMYVLVPDYGERTEPGQGPVSRLVRFPLASVVVHSRDQTCCEGLQHRQRWSHSVELLLCGQRLLLLFLLPDDGTSFLENLRLRQASLEGVRVVALPQGPSLRVPQGGDRLGEKCLCFQRLPSESLSSLSVEDPEPSPHLAPGLSVEDPEPSPHLAPSLSVEDPEPSPHLAPGLSVEDPEPSPHLAPGLSVEDPEPSPHLAPGLSVEDPEPSPHLAPGLLVEDPEPSPHLAPGLSVEDPEPSPHLAPGLSVEDPEPSPHLAPGLSPGLKLLSGLNPQQLQTVFHKHISLTDSDEIRQLLWLSVLLYKSPDVELTCLLLLSANAVYFLLEDSASSLSPHAEMEDLECADPALRLCCCLSIPLSHIHSVNVGLFDQYFRILGGSGEQVVCCLSRDSYATGQFLQELMSVLSLQQRAPPPEPSEQDFYSQFHTSGKMQNYELVHSRVKFIYPSEEEMGDLTFVVAERKNSCSSSSRSFNILLYLLVFQVLPQSSALSASGTAPLLLSSSGSTGPVLQPRTLILTSTDVFLLDEDYVSYPLPDFAKEPPSRERYHLREARRIRDLDRVLLGYQTYPQALTLVFDELPGPDLLCPLSLDHFSAQATPATKHAPGRGGGGAGGPGGGAYSAEVQWCVFVPSAESRERLISLLARQWEALCSRELPVELTG